MRRRMYNSGFELRILYIMKKGDLRIYGTTNY